MKQQENCEICYRIICKRCGWIASEDAISQIQKGKITACPECGWYPD